MKMVHGVPQFLRLKQLRMMEALKRRFIIMSRKLYLELVRLSQMFKDR